MGYDLLPPKSYTIASVLLLFILIYFPLIAVLHSPSNLLIFSRLSTTKKTSYESMVDHGAKPFLKTMGKGSTLKLVPQLLLFYSLKL